MALDSEYFVIQTMQLTKIFRDFWGHKRVIAVDKLDLEIQSHEVFGLLGPNGSGKSTTVKLLLGLLFATHGTARVFGQPPGDVKTNQRIGYLPEESHLYPFLNARETLDFYGKLFGLSPQQRRRRIDSLLDMVGLVGAARRPVGEFSKGMARRIGLAQALINDPDLLILDEPTSGLDPIGTRQIKDLITELGRRGKTVLLCSHLLADVEDVCTRIGILYGGRMHALGTVDELLTQSRMTQIRSPKLSPDAIARIEAIIHAENHHCQIDVQTPRARLEDFFLRVVAQAHAAQMETSGAVMGTGVSDFLTDNQRGPEPKTVIEQLVAGREHESAVDQSTADADSTGSSAPITVPVPESDSVRHDVLESLIDSSISTVPTSPVTTSENKNITLPVQPRADVRTDAADTTKAKSDQPDRSIIDRLTTGDDSQDLSTSAEDQTSNPQQKTSRPNQ